MTTEDYFRILRQHDDPVFWEYPGGWQNYDYKAAENRFLDLVKAIEKAVKKPCSSESGSNIQDASFIGQIIFPHYFHSNPNNTTYLRISHFGNLTAYYDDSALKASYLETINQVLHEQGYIYIPTKILEAPYTGLNPGVTGIADWWTRFFDWV